MCRTARTDSRFAKLGSPRRVWAVSAIHADAQRLTRLHDDLLPQIKAGDRIVYMGNYTGHGRQAVETLDELLTFRRLVLSIPGVRPSDLVYLRGGQEEILHKLLELHYAPDPVNVFLWMLGNGLSSTLYSYGMCPHDGLEACRSGSMGILKWTNKLRAAMRKNAGHDLFYANLTRAAHTAEQNDFPMLFVHAGLDTGKPLPEQGDALWWSGRDFPEIHERYDPFAKVFRGYDPTHGGMYVNGVTATLDGGCGFGGALVGAALSHEGEIAELFEV